MKKYMVWLLALILCLTLFACSKKVSNEATTQSAFMSWQEQYDLGIRLLNEGNYEEAILVFQTMIQINPKRSEGYQKLADAYVAVGEYEKAASVLADGFQVTGVASLEQQLKDVQARIEALTAQTGSPSEAPEIPQILQYNPSIGFPATTIEYEEDQYAVFTEDAFSSLTSVITSGQDGDQETIISALHNLDTTPLDEISYVWRDENDSYNLRGWTVWNGSLLGYSCWSAPAYDELIWQVEYRPTEGTGFYLSWDQNGGYTTFQLLVGQVSGWLYHGEISYQEIHTLDGVVVRGITGRGTAKNELLHGEYRRFDQEFQCTSYYVYENGMLQVAFTDPDSGEDCIMKQVTVVDEATEIVTYAPADGYEDIMEIVTYALIGPLIG